MPEREMSPRAKAMYDRTFGERIRKRKEEEAEQQAIEAYYYALQPWQDPEGLQGRVEQGWRELGSGNVARRRYRKLITRLIAEGLIRDFD